MTFFRTVQALRLVHPALMDPIKNGGYESIRFSLMLRILLESVRQEHASHASLESGDFAAQVRGECARFVAMAPQDVGGQMVQYRLVPHKIVIEPLISIICSSSCVAPDVNQI